MALSKSTFDKLSEKLHTTVRFLKETSDYVGAFQELMHYIDTLVEKGEDINSHDSEGNETFLSHFYYLFYDHGDCFVLNCKVYNQHAIEVFKHCLDLDADLSLRSYNSRYGHHEYEEQPIFADIMHTIIYLFDKRLSIDDEDSFLIYDDSSLVPFEYVVPDDPYPEYSVQEMNSFYLMKFNYLSQMLHMVLKKMNFIIPEQYSDDLNNYIEFLETDFLSVFPSEWTNTLIPFNWYRSLNFNLFIILNGLNYKWSMFHAGQTRLDILVLYKVFYIDEIVDIISSYL